MTNKYKKIIYSLCAILSALGGQKIDAGWRSKAKYVYKHCVRPPVKGIWKFGKYISNTSWGKHKINDNITDKISDHVVSEIMKNKVGISQNIYSKGSKKLAEFIIKPPVYAKVSPLVDDIFVPLIANAIELVGTKIDGLIMNFLGGGKLEKESKVYFSEGDGIFRESSWEEMKSLSPLEYVLGTLYRGPEVKVEEDKVTYKTYDNFMMALNEAIVNEQNDNEIISDIAKNLRKKIEDTTTVWVYDSTSFSVMTEKELGKELGKWTEIVHTPIVVDINTSRKDKKLDKLELKYKFGDKSVTLTFNLEDNTNTKQTNDTKVYEIDCGDSETKKLVVKFETNKEEKPS